MNKILDALSAIQQFFKNNVQTYIDDKSDVILTEIAKLNLIGEYNSGIQYYKNNVVQYNGEAFICRVDTVGIAPTAHANNTNWGIIAKQGIQGESGTGLTWRGNYSSEIIIQTIALQMEVRYGQLNKIQQDNLLLKVLIGL